MELLNYIRLKEQKIQPNVNNSSRNCSINILKMKCLASESQLSTIKSYKDVSPSMFHLTIEVENDYSHFEGTEIEAKKPKARPEPPNPPQKAAQPPKPSPHYPSPHAQYPAYTKPGISKPNQSKSKNMSKYQNIDK